MPLNNQRAAILLMQASTMYLKKGGHCYYYILHLQVCRTSSLHVALFNCIACNKNVIDTDACYFITVCVKLLSYVKLPEM